MVVSLYFGVEKATCFKWLQNGDLLRSPVHLPEHLPEPVLKWYTQNHASGNQLGMARGSFFTKLHLPESVLSKWLKRRLGPPACTESAAWAAVAADAHRGLPDERGAPSKKSMCWLKGNRTEHQKGKHRNTFVETKKQTCVAARQKQKNTHF